MYYRDEENSQQEQTQLQEYADMQCPWADSCPYLQANYDTNLRQYHNYQRPRPHYPMPYLPYYPPFFNPYHHPYYPPYHQPYYPPYHHPYYQNHYEHHYEPHHDDEYDHGPGRDE